MKKILFAVIALLALAGCAPAAKPLPEAKPAQEDTAMTEYTFPAEDAAHEGTWLNWPHHHTYGAEYREELEPIWVAMAAALCEGENVHIVAYDEAERERITALLAAEQLDMGRIDFTVAKTDDVWARDTGPMFAFDEGGNMVIVDFAFDGWGKKMPYKNDDKIPQAVAKAKNIPIVGVSDFVLEGGSVEHDGAGTLMATKSSVISKNRNPGMTQAQAEEYLTRYLGAVNFIWLDGVTDEDITDAHIDGMARFYDENTLLTVPEEDFFELYEGILESDYEALLGAKNADGEPYELVELPLTAENVRGLDYKGSYLNYYVGNDVVLLPVYGDESDVHAAEIIGGLYKGRKIVPIDVTALYKYGGMLHCVTQQQPGGS